MSKYADYLRSQGVTEEDIKVLDTPVTQRAHDKLVADNAAAIAAESAKLEEYRTSVNEWNTTKIVPEFEKVNRDVITAKANEARLLAAVRASQDEGLKQVAKDMGYTVDGEPPKPKPDPNAPPFDTSKFMTKDEMAQVGNNVGDTLAAMQDVAIEHAVLFPNQRLNVRELRREAVAANKNIVQIWEQKYKVPEARAAQDAAATKTHEDKIRAEERDKVTREMADRYGSPDTRPLAPSNSPLVARKDDTVRAGKQPWDLPDQSANRVRRVVEKVITEQSKGVH